MNAITDCPRCDQNLREAGGLIGVEISSVYDGVLYWMCPACGWAWQRWPEGHRREQQARPYIDAVNASVAARGGEPR